MYHVRVTIDSIIRLKKTFIILGQSINKITCSQIFEIRQPQISVINKIKLVLLEYYKD